MEPCLNELPCDWHAEFAVFPMWPTISSELYKKDGNNKLLCNAHIYGGLLLNYSVAKYYSLAKLFAKSDVLPTLALVHGPYSIVYCDRRQNKLWFGKDYMGRQSLLLKLSPNCRRLILSSSMNEKLEGAIEVPTIGIFVFDFQTSTLGVHPWGPDLHFEIAVRDLESLLNMKLSMLKPIFKQSRNIIDSQLDPDPRDIACYVEVLFSIMEEKSPEHLDPKDKHLEFPNSDRQHPEISATGKDDLECLKARKQNSEMSNPVEASSDECLPKHPNLDMTKPENVDCFMQKLSEIPEIREKVLSVLGILTFSLNMRITDRVRSRCSQCTNLRYHCDHPTVGILFSGGLDSTVLAALADKFVSPNLGIDLINVSFENTEHIDHKATRKPSGPWSVNYYSPDRENGRQAFIELKQVFPKRTWNFVECNILEIEVEQLRSSIVANSIYPSSLAESESLGCALWFASRGFGILASTGGLYDSPCKTLLLGIGADELFGGYTRHRKILQTEGWSALTRELNSELTKISELNLGMVNRVVSEHGRGPIFPYLDEGLIEYVHGLKAWEKCFPTEAMPEGLGDKLLLRLVARELGLRKTANVPQISIQSGSAIDTILKTEAVDNNTNSLSSPD